MSIHSPTLHKELIYVNMFHKAPQDATPAASASPSSAIRFARTARELAQPMDLSYLTPGFDVSGKTHADLRDITSIGLGKMLAQVSIIVDPRATSTRVRAYGDAEMLEALHVDPRGGHLALSGEIPFRPESSRSHRSSSFQGNVFRSAVIIGGSYNNVSVGNGSVSSGRGISVTSDIMAVDGREVDKDRQILVVLTVSPRVDIRTEKSISVIGKIGIGGFLDGTLSCGSDLLDLYAADIQTFRSTVQGTGDIEIGTVRGDLTCTVSGACDLLVGSVAGRVSVTSSGVGDFVIAGGSTASASFTTSGVGNIKHLGIISGDAVAIASGVGNIKLAQVNGKCRPQISGIGHVKVNNQKYKARW